jgi:hypothetical protein
MAMKKKAGKSSKKHKAKKLSGSKSLDRQMTLHHGGALLKDA